MDDSSKPESEGEEAKAPNIKAEDNPWYLLATLYGVPETAVDELQAKNRVAWNRYFAVNLDEETRTKPIEDKRHPAQELTPCSPEELEEVTRAFAERCKASTKKLALPASDANIDFSNVEFEQDAFFEGYHFSRRSFLASATFFGFANFARATFSDDAIFDGATFSGVAFFGGATFSGVAFFGGATFSDDAIFDGATFSRWASFGGATFSGRASFDAAAFSHWAFFGGATFSGRASFDGVAFSSEAHFGNATFCGTSKFVNAEMKGETSFRMDDIQEGASSILRSQASSRHRLAWYHMAAPPQGQA